jgi:intracellular sulfur oxidation DsrE/DsrF family protein
MVETQRNAAISSGRVNVGVEWLLSGLETQMRLSPKNLPLTMITIAFICGIAGGALSSSLRYRLHAFMVFQQAEPQTRVAKSAGPGTHGMVIHIDQNDPATMKMALGNAENLIKHYEDKGEEVQIEFVANGPGLTMLRSDTSPVKDRITEISRRYSNVSFSACQNTINGISASEHKPITLIPEAKIVPAGVGRALELQEMGWAYFRP